MITINRLLSREVRAVFNKLLGFRRQAKQAAVTITTSPQGLRLEVATDSVAATYTEPGDYPSAKLVVPLQLFDDCQGTKAQTVTLEAPGSKTVTARWHNGKQPELRQYEVPEPLKDVAFPELPKEWSQPCQQLITALSEAMETTELHPSRYAISCILLRGNTGTIAGTDGRQLYKHEGFQFPWQDEVLIPRNLVFGSQQLSASEDAICGTTDYGLFVESGLWMIALARDKVGRFPRVDDVVPSARQAKSVATFDAKDARFLENNLARCRMVDEINSPVTLDLNGSVAVRLHGANQPHPTELVLSSSSRSGDEVRLTSNRKYLLRAMKLGLTDLHIFSPASAVLSTSGSKHYIWMPLGADCAIKPSPDCIRLVSDFEPAPIPSRPRIFTPSVPKPTIPDMPNQNYPRNGHTVESTVTDKPANPASPVSDSAIQQAEALRDSLHDSLLKTRELIVSLKREHRHTKLVRSTLSSLKQLQGIGA